MEQKNSMILPTKEIIKEKIKQQIGEFNPELQNAFDVVDKIYSCKEAYDKLSPSMQDFIRGLFIGILSTAPGHC